MPMTMRSDRKPPLASRSPISLRSRPPRQSTLSNLQTPSVTITKSRLRKPSSVKEQQELRPEYQTMSYELTALTKMVQDSFKGSTNKSANEGPMFKRGKFYEEYSARRNERLKRKRGETDAAKETPCKQYLGVRIESAKRSVREVKKFGSAMKMATPMMESRQVAATQRYSLRSSCKKPPLAMKTARKGY